MAPTSMAVSQSESDYSSKPPIPDFGPVAFTRMFSPPHRSRTCSDAAGALNSEAFRRGPPQALCAALNDCSGAG